MLEQRAVLPILEDLTVMVKLEHENSYTNVKIQGRYTNDVILSCYTNVRTLNSYTNVRKQGSYTSFRIQDWTGQLHFLGKSYQRPTIGYCAVIPMLSCSVFHVMSRGRWRSHKKFRIKKPKRNMFIHRN